MTPSVKGFSMAPVVARIRQLRDSGAIKQSSIEELLTEDELALLEHEVSPTLWYPISSLERMLLLMRDTLGGGDDDYWVTLGRESAQEILSARSISIVLTGARAFGRRAGTALIRIASLVLNVGQWRYEGEDLTDFEVVVEDAGSIPEALRLNVQGFIQVLASQFSGRDVSCTSTRQAPDRIAYRGLLRGDDA